MDIRKEFIIKQPEEYQFKIGRAVATALAGFIAGFIVAALTLIPYLLFLGKLSSIFGH